MTDHKRDGARALVGDAWRHMGTVTCVYLVHLGLALGLAWPIARLLGDPTLALPQADRALFEPGGMYLSEVLRLGSAALGSALEGLSFLALVGAYLGLVPLGALLFALTDTPRMNVRTGVVAATRFFAPLSLLLGLSVVTMAVAGAAPLLIAALLETKLKWVLGDRSYDLVTLGFRLLGLASIAVVGVVHDLARAAVVVREVDTLDAARLGVAAVRAAPWRAIGGWGVRGALALALVVAGAWAASRIGVQTGAKLAQVTVLHQAIAFTLVFLRADWLSVAVRLVRQVPEPD